ncbi:hypothetical protein LZ198_37325 [Myxococcus sp. K15C18031901]|uniref:DUF6900 domain-containing protein n=1 Tax=Myxococcus dinghuensis TaxID=2906761 RepID=UPI0020A82140|nr:hypothetical protein [Myxococcus dinghuensis]MCP3104540.1 hypothetical protein [Myxococcus dinghuensis]
MKTSKPPTKSNGSTKRPASESLETRLECIARRHTSFETLETRFGGIDFKEVSVWGLKAALEEAYQLGKADGSKPLGA